MELPEERTDGDAVSDEGSNSLTDEESPFGATRESRDDVSPHDLPLDHPGRQAAAERERRREGTSDGGAPD